MKSKRLCIIVAVILLLATLASLAGCNKNKETRKLAEYISYLEQRVYYGETADFSVTLTEGKKESTFVADGSVTNVVDYRTVTVVPEHVDLLNKEYTYKLSDINGKLAEGQLSKDMFGAQYSATVTYPEDFATPLELTLTSGEKEYKIELKEVTANCIGYLDVLTIAQNEFKDKIAENYEGEIFKREICIKFINDKSQSGSPYYWYIAFIADANDYFALLIDPTSGEIATKRE